jgi:hypothetical protein
VSSALISRSPDLKQLVDEEQVVPLVHGMLIVRDVASVTPSGSVGSGMLILPLTLRGDETARPRSHVCHWAGETPCDTNGQPLRKLILATGPQDLGLGISATHALCNMAVGREFFDHAEFVRTYTAIISAPALAIDARLAARRKGAIRSVEGSVHAYADTGTTRAGIGGLNDRLAERVAIIGLGGTGSYVLDLVSKTGATAIHLFDADGFEQHNAFRAPGAASMADIQARPRKVDYFASVYSRMHRRIVPHAEQVTRANMRALDGVTFVFMCLDDAEAKKPIIRHLERKGIDFVDAGIGLELLPDGGGLLGMVRVTASTRDMRSHVHQKERIPLTNPRGADVYDSNIQTADLNALAATLAVIRWKRLRGFYLDQGREHFSAYSVDANHMVNDDLSGVATDAPYGNRE